jgi:hypothetical protein
MKLLLLLVLFCSSVFGDELKVELNPTKPVAGEPFQAYFRVFTTDGEDPLVNFSPGGLEVVGKSNQGISTRTIYANGKLTVTREVTIVYDIVASKPGTSFLRDITVQIGPKTLRHPSIAVTVLKEPEQLDDVFVMADVPKRTVFLGEGVIVRYYLYSKVPVSNLDVKKYPKLNNFLKRFLQEPERTERVSVEGQLYMRTQIYAAKLFPEKTGEIKIDSLHLSATYPSSKSNDPFGAFGLSRDFKTKTMSSETIKLQVKPLPEPVPSHFSGLVGQHDFQIQVGNPKLIVNEPLEIKLTISGVGALENLEAPELIKNPSLEEFESNGDLKIADADNATKVFDYTYLAKNNLNLPGKDIILSYLDPNSERYVPITLHIPDITIAGGQVRDDQKKPLPKENKKEDQSKASKTSHAITEFAGPLNLNPNLWRHWLPYLNLSLGFLAVLLSVGWFVKVGALNLKRSPTLVPGSFRRGEFELHHFVQWLSPIISKTGKSPLMIIRDSGLSDETKKYFIDIISTYDYKQYSLKKGQIDFKYRKGPFKELGKYIESVKNESSKQS